MISRYQYLVSNRVPVDFLFLMNYCKMVLHLRLLKKCLLTNVTFEWLFSLMDRCNMCVQIPLLRKIVITNVTFEWLFSFMNSFNM